MKLDFAPFAVEKRFNRKGRKGRKEKTSVFYPFPVYHITAKIEIDGIRIPFSFKSAIISL